VLRYRVTNSEGKRVENVMPIGLVREFPKDEDARREADRLGLPVRINDSPLPGRIQFDFLAEHYLRADFGADSVRPKSANTISHVEHIVRAYLVPRFGNEIAEDIKPLDIQRWLKSLHENKGLAWTTIAKMRGVMHRIYKIGILHERVAKNPAQYVETRSKTDYKAVVITRANAWDSEGPPLASSLHAGAHLRCYGAPCFGDPSAALVGPAVERGKDSDFKMLGEGRGWRDQNEGVGRVCSVASGSGSPSTGMARTKPLREGWGFRVPVFESGRSCSPLRVYFCRRSSATGGKKSGSTYRGRSEVWTSQLTSQPKQLAGEQGESRTENRAGHPASRKNSDDAGSLHAERQR
jgi:hypothetical protein